MANAERLFNEAQALYNSAGKGFSFFGNKAEKYEDAAEKFKDAGNAFRTARELQRSGQAFERAAQIQEQNVKDPLEAAKMLQDAFKSYREVSPDDAVRVIGQSIEKYTAKGNFRRAADLKSDEADVLERIERYPEALKSLETAITWYVDEGIQATANKARQKAGQLAAVSGDYYKAVQIFVQAAEASLSTGPTGRFIVKTYLFKAGICQLATGDVVGAKKALDGWEQLDRNFRQEREGVFLYRVLGALEDQNADEVATIAAEWDRMTKMEDWMVTVLLQVKKAAEPEEEDFS